MYNKMSDTEKINTDNLKNDKKMNSTTTDVVKGYVAYSILYYTLGPCLSICCVICIICSLMSSRK